MPWIPRNVAAASIGTALAALVVVALAAAASQRTSAIVELQVAPRGPGSVSASPAGVDLDDDNAPVTEPCDQNDDDDSCRWGYEQGTSVTLSASAGRPAGPSSAGARPIARAPAPARLTLDAGMTSIVAIFSPAAAGREVFRRWRQRHGHDRSLRQLLHVDDQNDADACFELAPRQPGQVDGDAGCRPHLQGLESRLRADERADVHDRRHRSADLGGRDLRRRRPAAAPDHDQGAVPPDQDGERRRPGHRLEARLRRRSALRSTTTARRSP